MADLPRTKFNSPWTVENIETELNGTKNARGNLTMTEKLATKQDLLVIGTNLDAVPTAESTNPVTSGGVQAPMAELVDNGAKNLLKNELGSGTKSGLAYTTGTDGSIVITAGTATGGNADFVIPFTPTKTGQYVLQGCPSGGSGETYKGQIVLYPSMANVAAIFDNTSVTATLTGGTQYAYRFRVYNGTAIGDVTIYPMVCSLAAWDVSHAYQPYRPSWQEMYDMILALQSGGNRALTMQTLQPTESTEPEQEER